MSDSGWIVIPKWDDDEDGEGFQHYKDRDPKWIKVYRRLLAKDEYITMSFHLRGILQSLWLEYAASNRQIRDNTLTLTRRLGQRVTTRDLESLNHAGFIEFAASAPLAPCYPRERIKSKRKTLSETPQNEPSSLSTRGNAILNAILNGALTTIVDLDAELRARGKPLSEPEKEVLRAELHQRYPIRAASA